MLQDTEGRFASRPEDLGDGEALSSLDLCVEIDEAGMKRCGELGAHGALPGPGEPDEDQVRESWRGKGAAHPMRSSIRAA